MNKPMLIYIGSIVGVCLVVVLAFWFHSRAQPAPVVSTSSAPPTDQLQSLKQQVDFLTSKVDTLSSPSAAVAASSVVSPSSSVTQQLSSLQTTVNDLNTRVTRLEQGGGQSQSASASAVTKPSVYIPLGPAGATTNQSYNSIQEIQATVDTDDFPGYTSAQLELSLLVYQGNGQAFAQLYDSTDGKVVANSQLTTTSQNYVDLITGNLTLFQGKKLYTIQLKSLTGYEVDVLNARLKVNF